MKKSVLLAGLVLALSAYSQSLTSVSGTVVDPTGAVIPGATIVLENVERGFRRAAVSDAAGRYAFPQLQPDTYRITAKAQGFSDVQISDVQLQVNSPATVDIRFEKVGAVAETISVSAEAVQVNTTDASLGNAVGASAITQLPFFARNVVALLAIQPGVTYFGSADDYRSGAVNGGKSDQGNVTLDGVDVNDQQYGYAFSSILRVTLDSVQEFRSTTLNPTAEHGRTSGAQVALVTKNGTNDVHGALYEYHRNTRGSANDFFLNMSGVPRRTLLINVFGGSVGGPIVKNRLFYFLNYEGRRDASKANVLRTVPSDDLRQGIVRYQRTDGSVGLLTPAEIRSRIDPKGVGANPTALQLFQTYPRANDFTTGDGLNFVGFRFTAPINSKQDTYITRFDYVLDAANRHTVFGRGNLQNDRGNGVPQFPGEPPNEVHLSNNKGFAIGWNAVFKPNFIGTTRYGFTREGDEYTGLQTASAVSFRNLSDRYGLTRGISRILPVNHISQTFDWQRGAHNVRFGGDLRWISNRRVNYANSFHSASTNLSWLRGTGTDLQAGVPDLDRRFRVAYGDTMMALLGIITQGNALYNYDIQGNAQPVGAPVRRKFAGEEYEMYVQDTWRVRRGLTITAGLRNSLMPPVYEANGQQTSAIPSLGGWFNLRGRLAQEGKSQMDAGQVRYVVASSAEGKPLYAYHKKNFAPRLAIAYSPQSSEGWRRWLFGGPGRTSIRAGWGMFYDLFGQGLIRLYDSTALGLQTRLVNPSSSLTSITAPRFTGIFNVPGEILLPAPKAGFPQDAPNTFAIANSIDDTIKPPYTMTMNLTVGREFRGGIYIQGSYVGRQSRRSLIQRDLAMPTDLTDSASGMTYFQAGTQMVKLLNAKTPVAQVPKVPFWENLWPGAAGSGKTATQNIYELYQAYAPDWSSVLFDLDRACDPACSKLGRHAMFSPQYSALAAWSSIAGGNYHAMQWTVRKRLGQGVQLDFNYTWAKSIDLASVTQRFGSFSGFVVNSWSPGQRKAVSDYDVTQAWSSAFVAALPFGRNKKFLSGAGGVLNHLVGGWQLSGVWQQSTELPFSVGNGRNWPTNWQITGYATQVGPVPAPTKSKNAPAVAGKPGPNMFADPNKGLAAYDFTMPGESGQRNGVRGDGYFGINLGLSKRINITERQSVQFRWEVFNVSNAVRFDVNSLTLDLGNTGSFGKYSGMLNSPRQMQFALRYEF